MSFPPWLTGLHDLTSAPHTIWANRAWAMPVSHVVPDDESSSRAKEVGSVVLVTEDHIDEVFFPANWAFSRILRAHLSL
jgi:hypothetical protein